MDQTLQNQEPTPQAMRSKKPIIIIILSVLVTIIMIAAVGYVGYWYGSKDDEDSETVATESKTDGSTDASHHKDTPAPTFHSVLAVGHPFNTDKKITTKLGVPNGLQSIVQDSSIQDPGFTAILANKFNEEMGRWKFGNPTVESSYSGDISLIHIGEDWLQQTSVTPDGPGGYTFLGYDFTTPAQKAATLARIETETADCSKDGAKGFTIAEVVHVCYEPKIFRQALGSYNPLLIVRGYGVIDGQKYVFAGDMVVKGDIEYSDDEATQNGNEFAKGNIPKETQEVIDEYVAALKNTTIVSSAR